MLYFNFFAAVSSGARSIFGTSDRRSGGASGYSGSDASLQAPASSGACCASAAVDRTYEREGPRRNLRALNATIKPNNSIAARFSMNFADVK